MGLILTLAPILLEILKLFWGSSSTDQKKLADKIRAELAVIRDAIQKSQDTEGDTSDLENAINKRG